jgi:hypothetical protein
MIFPVEPSTDYLTFKCDDCGETFDHVARIFHDGPSQTDTQKYDVRNWIIAGIDLRCPKCKKKMTYKLNIREDL